MHGDVSSSTLSLIRNYSFYHTEKIVVNVVRYTEPANVAHMHSKLRPTFSSVPGWKPNRKKVPGHANPFGY